VATNGFDDRPIGALRLIFGRRLRCHPRGIVAPIAPAAASASNVEDDFAQPKNDAGAARRAKPSRIADP
jgi:hypothetical protein